MLTKRHRRELLFLGATVAFLAAGAIGFWLLRPPVLTVAVGPRDSDSIALFQTFADTLKANNKRIRLAVLPVDDVKQSAAALQDGKADLALVRPDVAMPSNALTLAIMRNQAMVIASMGPHGIHEFKDLARSRIGLVERHEADFQLLQTVGRYYGLTMSLGDEPSRSAAGIAHVVRLGMDELPEALATKRIDAVATIVAPTNPEALHVVQLVQAASPDRRISFVEVPDDDAITQLNPLLQSVTIPSGIFGGEPRLPKDDVKTVGSSYRLVARDTLDRTVVGDVTQDLFELRGFLRQRSEAADYMQAPDYDTTAAATSARLPIHPGAIDYYERDQQSFLDRYEDLGYVAASLLGGLGSALAWAYHRFTRNRRQRIDSVLERLSEIKAAVRCATAVSELMPLLQEIDDLASEVVMIARHDDDARHTIGALTLALQTVRAATEARLRDLAERPQKLLELPT